jgi:hypothetical protein
MGCATEAAAKATGGKTAGATTDGLRPVGRSATCPTCGTDVMATGWTEHAAITRSYMRFHGRGAELTETAAELKRMA